VKPHKEKNAIAPKQGGTPVTQKRKSSVTRKESPSRRRAQKGKEGQFVREEGEHVSSAARMAELNWELSFRNRDGSHPAGRRLGRVEGIDKG